VDKVRPPIDMVQRQRCSWLTIIINHDNKFLIASHRKQRKEYVTCKGMLTFNVYVNSNAVIVLSK
jgi:hypothetical protein